MIVKMTKDQEAVLAESIIKMQKREDEFYARHGVQDEKDTRFLTNGGVTDAHKAWVKAVETEFKSGDRTSLNTPLGRKCFILGFKKKQQGEK